MVSLTIIIPVYNETNTIIKIINKIKSIKISKQIIVEDEIEASEKRRAYFTLTRIFLGPSLGIKPEPELPEFLEGKRRERKAGEAPEPDGRFAGATVRREVEVVEAPPTVVLVRREPSL